MQKHRRGDRDLKRKLRNQNSPISPSVKILLENFVNSLDDDSFKTSYLKSEYLSKYADPSPGSADARKAAAIAKWKSVEKTNEATNLRLRTFDKDFNILPRVTINAFLRRCRQTVRDILGPLSDNIVVGSFSGGASTSLRRTESHPARKYVGLADATELAVPYVELIYRECPLLRKFGSFDYTRVVSGAELFTVPKKNDIDRCACKEPDINMYLQKGVGKHIRRRLLRKSNINLNNQSINRDLARIGSIDGSLATLDLSSASDTVTIELVRTLLPSEWFEYLNDIRSQSVVVEGDTVVTEMFSSMGNGFTFELESLLFYAIVRTVLYFEGVPGRLSVYGDDIVMPAQAADLAMFVLSYFGFVPNQDKSFVSGPFRESCGGHYYNGEDVTPFYLKRPPTHLTDLIRVVNQFRRWCLLDTSADLRVSGSVFYETWNLLRSFVPPSLWGGFDYSLDTVCVSNDPPHSYLVRVNQKRSVTQTGAYLLWQNSNWGRSGLDESNPHDETDTMKMCRRRRVRHWGDPAERNLFIEEVL